MFRKYTEKYFGTHVDINVRIRRMMTQYAALALFLDAVARILLIGFKPELFVIPILVSISICITFVVSLKRNIGNNGYFVLLLVTNTIMMPVSFALSGGTDSGNPMWMIFGIIMVFLLLSGWQFHVMLILTFLADFTLFVVDQNCPELIIRMNRADVQKDTVASLIIVVEILAMLFRYQNKLYEEERSRSEQRRREIEELSKTKSQFFANMSHEIRTPINTVIGLNEMTLREDISDEVAENATNIQAASKLLLTTINDILDLSKLESGNIEIMPAAYPTAALFSDLVNMTWVRASQKKLELRADIAEDLPSVLLGDEIRIKQVLTNILTNAVKYTEKGSVMLTARGERLSDETIRLKISVEDTGIGIRRENIGELFNVFKQVDKEHNKKIEGTGLGLSISKQLVDLMGGDITVDSIYQKGSCFTVTIDQRIIDNTPIGGENFMARREIKDREHYRQSFEAPEAKVLIVDDNEMNLMVARKLLRDTKVQVDTASSGEECLEKTAAGNYHVILMDHMMPVMDGEETLARLRSRTDGYCQNTPVIALTANVMSNAAVWYHERGFDGYLAKPISGVLLETVLKKFLPNELIEYSAEEENTGEEQESIFFRRRRKKICICADGICDLPDEWLAALDIKLMYYYVITEEGRFIDTREINSAELLDYITNGRKALSSCATIDEYERFFSDRLSEAEQVIHISTASGVGKGYDTAIKAAGIFDNVTVVNSGHLSSGMGIMALYAAKMAADGCERDEIVSMMEKLRDKIQTSFIVAECENMYRNGRMSKSVLNLCNRLHLKPVLCMRKNKITLRGFGIGGSFYKNYIRFVLRYKGHIDNSLLFITHAGLTVKQLEKIRKESEKQKTFDVVKLQNASSAISCNCGKGCFGLIYMKK